MGSIFFFSFFSGAKRNEKKKQKEKEKRKFKPDQVCECLKVLTKKLL